jgi:hypothetical protein
MTATQPTALERMPAVTTSAAWLAAALYARAPRRPAGDRGEGVISAAIAVLIMAFLGAAMWVAFNNMWLRTQSKVCDQVGQIGAGQGQAGTPAC